MPRYPQDTVSSQEFEEMPSVSHDANLHFQTLKTLKKSFRLGPDSEDLRDRRVIYVVVQFMRFGL